MRALTICLLAIVGGLLPALETPLVLVPDDTSRSRIDYRVVVNPSLGTMTIYEVSGEELRSWNQYNFLGDLEYLTQVRHPENRDWFLAQAGTTSTTPTYPEMIRLLGTADAGRELAEGTLPLDQRATNTEQAFWSTTPTYDGNVRAALSGNMVFLVIPSSYTIMVYWLKSQTDVQLVGWRNYRPDLYIPQVYESIPTPQTLLDRIEEDFPEVAAQHREQLEERLQDVGAEAMGTTIPIQPSEPWVGAVGNRNRNVLAIFDAPNKRMLLYEHLAGSNGGTLTLRSTRNIEIDLLIPTGIGTSPAPAVVVENYNRRLEQAGMPRVDVQYAIELSRQSGVSARNTSDVQIETDANGWIYVDYAAEQKLAVYRPFGRSDQLELMAMRDYRPETGLSVATKEMLRMLRGVDLLEGTVSRAKRDNAQRTFEDVSLALTWNPLLLEQVENSRTARKLRYAAEVEGWAAMIETAAAAKAELEARNQAIEDAIEARRNAAANR